MLLEEETKVEKVLNQGMEVFHPKWLANPVLVLKKNKEWRMCIDYTSLNKVCPKDPFALPRIDQIIDVVAGSELLCFLDAYSRYNQIKLNPEDWKKTAFITPFGAYCYKNMTFGLKMRGRLIRGVSRSALRNRLGVTSMLMLMMW